MNDEKGNGDLRGRVKESAVQELDEPSYWLELLVEANLVTPKRLGALLAEADELTAIFVASVKTAKRSRNTGGR